MLPVMTETPLRMLLGTAALVGFLRWVMWLADRREPTDPHPTQMSDDWRREHRFWVDPW